jgi:hypothetical protein
LRSPPHFASASISGLPPSQMSVPRPAMLVEIVTAPLRPACATISASRSWCFAFNTLCGHALLLQLSCEHLGLLDRDRADQHRLTRRVALLDVVDHRIELLALRS